MSTTTEYHATFTWWTSDELAQCTDYWQLTGREYERFIVSTPLRVFCKIQNINVEVVLAIL